MKKNIKIVILIMSFIPGLFASSQISFTKPGYMMRIPTSSASESKYVFRAGFGTDIFSFNSTETGLKPASGVFIDSEISRSFNFGLSAVQPGMSDTSAVEFGINLNKNVFTYGDISVAIGLWDFVVTQVDGETQLKDDYSFFAVISSEKNIGQFGLNSYMGVGSGSLSRQSTTVDSTTTPGVFAGFLLRTAVLKKQGGMDIIAEFDGAGINIGLRIPITEDYRLNLGLSQMQYLGNFGKENITELPSISVGLALEIPRLASSQRTKRPMSYSSGKTGSQMGEEATPKFSYQDDFDYNTKLDSIIQVADYEIQILKDSLLVSRAEVENLTNSVSFLRQQKSVLEDSLQSVKLQKHVLEQNINLALKHLSRSLRYFYAGNYEESLNEADMAIQLNPNLSLAYARRGSIYYKMGDLDRATINWNLALRIDPGYDDVRNILKIVSENRLRTTSFIGK